LEGEHLTPSRDIPMREVTFSPERALESLLFLASKLENPTFHEVLKLRYFADKMHFAKYGFLASGDRYVAMRFGPVASNTYNMMKASRGDRGEWIHPRFVALVEGALSIKNNHVLVPLRPARTEDLPPSDVECLEAAIQEYGGMSFGERTELSHDSAWKKAWDSACEEAALSDEMSIGDIAATLNNADEILEHLRAQA
jgi:uncharacterized phage-associated protein